MRLVESFLLEVVYGQSNNHYFIYSLLIVIHR